jgi:hypothetical protein
MAAEKENLTPTPTQEELNLIKSAGKKDEEGEALLAKSRAEYAERMKGKPTPTQAENDAAMLGKHVHEKEDDGSGPDLAAVRAVEAAAPKPAATYQTRQARAAAPVTPPKTSGAM